MTVEAAGVVRVAGVVRATGAEEAMPYHSSAASITDKICVRILQH